MRHPDLGSSSKHPVISLHLVPQGIDRKISGISFFTYYMLAMLILDSQMNHRKLILVRSQSVYLMLKRSVGWWISSTLEVSQRS
jgi:hypothetical protein